MKAETMKTSWLLGAAMLAAGAVAQNAEENRVVLGKLGQAVKSVPITSKPGMGRKYYTVKPYEYLVLNTGPKGFYRVLLQNGQKGYVASTSVARLPYDVTAKATPTRSSGSLASRSRGSTSFSQYAVSSPSARAAVANYGTSFTGTPYVWGGNDPNNGIDCSAFVKYLYGKIGVSLPRTAAEQALVGQPITRLEDLKAGDRLYFWENKRNKIGHTGIYMGNGYFVHSSRGRGGVATDYLGSQKWLRILVAARR